MLCNFKVENDRSGWTGTMKNALNEPDFTGDGMKLTPTGPDPSIYSPPASADADQYRYLIIKMKTKRGSSNEIYFITSTSPALGEDKCVRSPVKADNKFHTYSIDMKTCEKWEGEVTGFRFDFANGPGEMDNEVEVEFIGLK